MEAMAVTAPQEAPAAMRAVVWLDQGSGGHAIPRTPATHRASVCAL